MALQLLDLSSEEFMTSMFGTTILNATGSDLGTQQEVNCGQARKYVHRMLQGSYNCFLTLKVMG